MKLLKLAKPNKPKISHLAVRLLTPLSDRLFPSFSRFDCLLARVRGGGSYFKYQLFYVGSLFHMLLLFIFNKNLFDFLEKNVGNTPKNCASPTWWSKYLFSISKNSKYVDGGWTINKTNYLSGFAAVNFLARST